MSSNSIKGQNRGLKNISISAKVRFRAEIEVGASGLDVVLTKPKRSQREGLQKGLFLCSTLVLGAEKLYNSTTRYN